MRSRRSYCQCCWVRTTVSTRLSSSVFGVPFSFAGLTQYCSSCHSSAASSLCLSQFRYAAEAVFCVGLAVWLLAVSFGIISISWLQLPEMDWAMFGKQSLAAILNGMLTGMAVGGALSLVGSLFNI